MKISQILFLAVASFIGSCVPEENVDTTIQMLQQERVNLRHSHDQKMKNYLESSLITSPKEKFSATNIEDFRAELNELWEKANSEMLEILYNQKNQKANKIIDYQSIYDSLLRQNGVPEEYYLLMKEYMDKNDVIRKKIKALVSKESGLVR